MRPDRILILHKGHNASLDYYLKARIAALGIPHEARCIDRDRLDDVDTDGLLVIICRYVRPSHVRWIGRHRRRLAGVAYFVDDDIPALLCERKAELGYRFYLAYFACLPMLMLNGTLTHLWVSTEGLARAMNENGGGRAVVLDPAPVIADHLPPTPAPARATVKIVYHATRVHQREHGFLAPVMEEVMRRRPQARFEVLARGPSQRIWQRADIARERLGLLAPMGWETYYRYSRDNGADIALMPLLEGAANDSRAHTKLIDCTRLGAAAVMSDVASYRRLSTAGIPRIRNRPDEWVEALLDMIDHADRREAVRQATRQSVLDMTFSDIEPFPGLPRPAGARDPA